MNSKNLRKKLSKIRNRLRKDCYKKDKKLRKISKFSKKQE